MILVAVIASILVALCSLVLATSEVAHLMKAMWSYIAEHPVDGPASPGSILTTMVRSIDGYLLSAIMIIFAFGLYELFIGKIDIAEHSEVAERLLLIRNLDDLKDRLAKMVVLMLVIEFFQHALEIPIHGMVDLLYLAIGIVLVGATLFLVGRMSKHEDHKAQPSSPSTSD
jgi:uncharacterized membrane protein YqhA